MFWAFIFLFMLDGVIGILAWLAAQRVLAHMRANPDAAELVAKHVIAPLLTGTKETSAENEPQPKKTKGTLI